MSGLGVCRHKQGSRGSRISRSLGLAGLLVGARLRTSLLSILHATRSEIGERRA